MISLSKTSCVRRLCFPPVEQSGAHSGSCKLVCGCRGKWIFLTQMLSCHHLCLATREADVLFLDLRLVVTDLGVTYVSQNCICTGGATVFIELYAVLGGGHGNPFRYSCLENTMDKGAWWAAVHEVTKSWIRLKWLSTCSLRAQEALGEVQDGGTRSVCLYVRGVCVHAHIDLYIHVSSLLAIAKHVFILRSK